VSARIASWHTVKLKLSTEFTIKTLSKRSEKALGDMVVLIAALLMLFLIIYIVAH
jgi:hypothetical protein